MRWCARSSVGRVGGEDMCDGVLKECVRMCEMVG